MFVYAFLTQETAGLPPRFLRPGGYRDWSTVSTGQKHCTAWAAIPSARQRGQRGNNSGFYMHTCTHTHACTHTHIHTHTHTHTHKQRTHARTYTHTQTQIHTHAFVKYLYRACVLLFFTRYAVALSSIAKHNNGSDELPSSHKHQVDLVATTRQQLHNISTKNTSNTYTHGTVALLMLLACITVGWFL